MLADRFGAARLVAVGGLLFALLIWLMGRAGTEAAAVGVFLSLGLASGLTEPAERALVARLGGAASGRAFGGYHALTGLAALPAALAFGGLYQKVGAGAALTASAVATGLLAVAVATTVSREG
jgi:nitrate/nitrite transporter NarK